MRMRFRGFSVIPMTAIVLAMMLPAKAVWAQSGPGDQATASPKHAGDDLAGKLARREVQRSSSSIPGREIVQVETLIPAGVEFGMARSSGRRGRLHRRRSGRDDGARSCRRHTECGGWIPHSAADPAQCPRSRPENRADAIDLHRRDRPAARDIRGRTRREIGQAPAAPRSGSSVGGFEKTPGGASVRATPSSASRRNP